MRKSAVLLASVALMLLTACDIEDQLEIRADGSGTYHAKIVVEKVAGHILARIRADAEKDGFRIVEQGESLTSKYIVVRKNFTDVRALSGPQSSFDLRIETRSFIRRRYRLRATVGSVAGASFERRFTILMPANVTSTTAGNNEGRRVTWYCANGGAIDIAAEHLYVPITRYHVLALMLVAVCAASFVVLLRRRDRAAVLAEAGTCTTCHSPIAGGVRYCPSCGDRVLPAAGDAEAQRPRGSP